jgi:gas vesicle protein
MTEKSDLLKGFFIGGLIGLAVGILFAPKSGKETRDDLTRKTNDLLAKAKEEYEKAAEKSKLVYEGSMQHLNNLSLSAKDKVGDIKNKVGELANQSVDAIQNNKSKFKKAIDAGLEAYREETSKEKV